MEGKFDPVALSLDESGRIYLLARSGGRLVFWLITSGGARRAAFDFPEGSSLTGAPPAVGYDHRAFVSEKAELLGYSGEMIPAEP